MYRIYFSPRNRIHFSLSVPIDQRLSVYRENNRSSWFSWTGLWSGPLDYMIFFGKLKQVANQSLFLIPKIIEVFFSQNYVFTPFLMFFLSLSFRISKTKMYLYFIHNATWIDLNIGPNACLSPGFKRVVNRFLLMH